MFVAMSYPYHYHNDPSLPTNAMTPTTPGASSTASTPMAYPWDYDVSTGAPPSNPGMSLVPAEFPPQAPHQLFPPQEAPAPEPQPQINAPTVIQLEERRPLVPSQMRSRNRPHDVSGENRARPRVETRSASGSRPSSSSGLSPSGLLRVEPTHVHAERDKAHPYRRPQSPEDAITRASSAGVGRGGARRGSEQPQMRFSPHEMGESSGVMQAGGSGVAVGGGGGGLDASAGFSRMRYARRADLLYTAPICLPFARVLRLPSNCFAL
ncbi:hypothetical protein OF83DRAFT_578372 [Amylostereum chailletii]|nr:hypothetical protein OF83DRAFT_578372 [Amylostereum chailletii]